MIDGLTSLSLGRPDFLKAMEQHNLYVDALRSCGLEVMILEADSQFPDSVFVEDVALCTPECAIVTNPGACSRNGEKLKIKSVLESYYKQVESIRAPGSLDAGDVMMVGQHYILRLKEDMAISSHI